MKHIAIFASGTGTNALKIIEHFENHSKVKVSLIISNRATAPVLDIAKANQIDSLVIQRATFYNNQDILTQLNRYSIDFIVLAGFLWLIPPYLVQAYPKKMINIHPALLPKFGGKGMYGMNVHRAVKAAAATETGITIHFVNEAYDEGDIVFQAHCSVLPKDTPEDIANKVRQLEHQHFAIIIERLVS